MTGKAALMLGGATCALVLAGSAPASERIHYTYDALGRLVGVSRTEAAGPGFATGTAYDAAGNRANMEVAEIVPNFSFELPEIGMGYVYNPAVARAAFTSYAGVTGNNSAWGFTFTSDGDQVAFIQTYGGAIGAIALSVIGLEPGATYRVHFRLTRRPGYGLNPVTVAAGGIGLGTFTPSSTAWESFASAPFTATASNVTISFTGSPAQSDSASGLDLVTIGFLSPPPAPPPVPLPPPPPPPPPSPPPPPNQPPVANPDSLSAPKCVARSVNVIANDTDPEGHYPLALTAVDQGWAWVESGTNVGMQTPETNGTYVITYTVADSLGATANGSLTVTVSGTQQCV